MEKQLTTIAHVRSPYNTKFGAPRQSGLTDVISYVVFEKKYSVKEAFFGLEKYSHIWLLWDFSLSESDEWSPTVRPPKLGGNKRVGVFATRSPFRPSPIGLSCVKLIGIEIKDGQAVLTVEGADLVDGTPIFDIKPYLPYCDSIPDANGSFGQALSQERISVEIPATLEAKMGDKLSALYSTLALDPRPAYQEDGRVYGFVFDGKEVKFTVSEGLLTVISIE